MNCNAKKWVTACVACLLFAAPSLAEEKKIIPPTADALSLVEKVKQAYAGVKSMKLVGSLSADFDVAGKTQNKSIAFTSDFQAPASFRHEVVGEVIAGSTGQRLYTFEPRRNVYTSDDLPAKKGSYRQFPGIVGQLLDTQNPALALAVSANSLQDMIDGANAVKRAADTTVNQQILPTLSYTDADGRLVSLAFDGKTYLLRQATYDIGAMMRLRGADAVKKALIMVAYAQVDANVAPFAPDHFAWSAPATAREVGADVEPASIMVGKPAPDFTLTGLDGKQVTLSSLKGKVVLLDFWATWCPPCVRSLPEINALYHENQSVKVFAVNVGEGKAAINEFLKSKNLDLPVLMDTDEAVKQKYGIDGIPTTIIIKPDGVIQQVFVGMPPGGKADIQRELTAAKK